MQDWKARKPTPKAPLEMRKMIKTIQEIMLRKNKEIPESSANSRKQMERQQPARKPSNGQKKMADQ